MELPAGLDNPFLFYPAFLAAASRSPFLQIPAKSIHSSAAAVSCSDSHHNQIMTPSQSNFTISKILGFPSPCPLPNSTDTRATDRKVASLEHQKQLTEAAKFMWIQQFANSAPHPMMSNRHIGRKTAKKRKLGRNPRIPFTQQQIDSLEMKYAGSRYLSSLDVAGLSKQLDLSEARVKIWFQNRRARERRDKKPEIINMSGSSLSPHQITLPSSSTVLSDDTPSSQTDTAKTIWSPTSLTMSHHQITTPSPSQSPDRSDTWASQ